MTTGARLGAYGLVLAAALAVGAGLGAVAGPIDVGGDEHRDDPVHTLDADDGARPDEPTTTADDHAEGHGGFAP